MSIEILLSLLYFSPRIIVSSTIFLANDEGRKRKHTMIKDSRRHRNGISYNHIIRKIQFPIKCSYSIAAAAAFALPYLIGNWDRDLVQQKIHPRSLIYSDSKNSRQEYL